MDSQDVGTVSLSIGTNSEDEDAKALTVNTADDPVSSLKESSIFSASSPNAFSILNSQVDDDDGIEHDDLSSSFVPSPKRAKLSFPELSSTSENAPQEPVFHQEISLSQEDDEATALAAEEAAKAMTENDEIEGQPSQEKQPEEATVYRLNPDPGLAQVAGIKEESEATIEESDLQVEDSLDPKCRLCNRGPADGDSRPLLRFLPVAHDLSVATASPSVDTFSQDILVHVFCGKTASILPHVRTPELEILTKAGLKNKHGIGAEVNAALARTRSAVLVDATDKEKTFYLVREFEAHLAAIRHTRITYLPGYLPPEVEEAASRSAVVASASSVLAAAKVNAPPPVSPTPSSPSPAVDAANSTTVTTKITCPCGGTHFPAHTARGAQSWKAHVATQRHQRWVILHQQQQAQEEVVEEEGLDEDGVEPVASV